MDETLLLAAGACIVLAALAYLMWRDATAQPWGEFAQSEKRKWRLDEEKRKEA
jgi:hypothetical protein